MSRTILGGGPSALRAAAALEGARWLSSGPDRLHPELPEDRGLIEDVPGAAEALAAAYGAAPPVDGWTVGIHLDGEILTLPFHRRELLRLLPPLIARDAFAGWVRTRGRIRAQKLIGGGFEERCYQDWPVQRFGVAAYERLYARYGAARFGDPEQVNVSAARLHHALPSVGRFVAPGAGPAAGWQALRAAASDRQDIDEIDHIEVRDGKVSAIAAAGGAVPVDGELFYAGPLPPLADWLGDAIPPDLAWDLRGLTTRHRALVAMLRVGAGAELPDELHVLDGAPFFRVSRPERLLGAGDLKGMLLFHLAFDVGDPLWALDDGALADAVAEAARALGLPDVDPATARVDRLPDHDPSWVGPWHPRHVRITDGLQALGVHLVGRAATHRFIDAAQELRLVDALGRNPADAHEHQRTLLDPPVKLDDQDISITRFLER
ncbi:MAG: hypothetical protein H6739_02570 [Alphaproteobacteria bacterium]|nr:hypothetical protein [Alphaproteobacteria bacterium]